MSHKYWKIALAGAMLASLSVPAWARGDKGEGGPRTGNPNAADTEKRRDEEPKPAERRWTPIIPLGPLAPRLPEVPSLLQSEAAPIATLAP